MAGLTRKLSGFGGGAGGSSAFSALTGAPTDNSALATALAGKVDTTGNKFGFNVPVLPNETPLAAKTVAASPICDGYETVVSDVDCSGNVHQEWGGLQRGLRTIMSDGTEFAVYIQNNAGTDRLRLMRSKTGGPDGVTAWTQVDTVATASYKSILLRDKTRDQVIWVTVEGVSLSQIVKLRVYNLAGTQVGATYSVNAAGKGFAQQLDTNGFYYEAGISHTARPADRDYPGCVSVVLAGWVLPQPAAIQQNTTMCCYKQLQWLFWDGTNWQQEKVQRFPTGKRMDYDQVIVAAEGDPDVVYGLCQGNVAMWESSGEFTPERLAPFRLSPIAAYAFDEIATWYNDRRRNSDWQPPKVLTPIMDWTARPWDGNGANYSASNDIPEARTRQAMFHATTGRWWILYKSIRPNKYTAGFTATGSISGDTLTITAVTGTPIQIGTVITAHSLSTTGFLATKIIGVSTTPGTSGLTGTGGTGTYKVEFPHSLGSGTVSMCNAANPSVTAAPTSAWRIMIATLKGVVEYDGELIPGVGYGLPALTQVASGRVYCMFLARGSDATNTNCHLWELTRAVDGEVNTVALNLASQFNSTNNPVAGNVGFGCIDAYLGGAATSPARCSNQGPIMADYQHGSKMGTNHFTVMIARRGTDHNSGGATPTNQEPAWSTASKIDIGRFRVPA